MDLFDISEKEYGDKYNDHLLQQWVTCVEMSNSVSEHRINVNNLFITLNTALAALTNFKANQVGVFLSGIGIILCVIWIINNEYYKKLNKQKYNIILEIEKKLPATPFGYEWNILGKGKDKKKHTSFTRIEEFISVIFIVIYLTIICPFVLSLL